VYDNGTFTHTFPNGTAYIAAALKAEGHKVEIYNQDIHHYTEAELLSHLDANHYDAVGLGFIGNYYTYKKAIAISEAVNLAKERGSFYYILGGHGPSADPEFFLTKLGADAVVYGEGERGILDALECGPGIYRHELIDDIDSIPRPAYEEFPVEIYRMRREARAGATDFLMPMLTARGCPFQCNFCFRMDKGYRLRSIEAIVDDIQFLQREYRINYIDFTDELTMGSVKRTAELCWALLPLDIKWLCNGRLNFAEPDLLKLMKRAGCVYINYGIEVLDDDILKSINKKLTVEQITKGIEATLEAGISPGFNVIFGHQCDNRETLKKDTEFILKYHDGAIRTTIHPVTPWPGTEIYKEAIRRGLIKDCEDFYKKHTNSDCLTVNVTELTDEEFGMALHDANIAILENYYRMELERAKEKAKVFLGKDSSFRGYYTWQ
jgi:anaerobic magnesium-protoporphyrin IX monomethyl ester cyclase